MIGTTWWRRALPSYDEQLCIVVVDGDVSPASAAHLLLAHLVARGVVSQEDGNKIGSEFSRPISFVWRKDTHPR